jgi:tRNA pseudouridine13 synthase
MKDGLYDRVIPGDILAKPSGASFASEDVAAEQTRLEGHEISPTGPMFGHSMREPVAGSEAAEREESILAAAHLKRMDFARHGLLEGTRRSLGVTLVDVGVDALPDQAAIRLRFGLPSGAYATVVAGEILKPPADAQPVDLSAGHTE